jgi:hypothetical protein
MINLIKKLFNKDKKVFNTPKEEPKTNKKDYSYLLNLLKNNRIPSNFEGKYFYDERRLKLKVLGVYSYPDVDMNKTGIVVEYECGKIDSIHRWSFLFKIKPHEWFNLLDDASKRDYSRDLNSNVSYEDLEKRYYSKIPIDNSREWKLKQLGI